MLDDRPAIKAKYFSVPNVHLAVDPEFATTTPGEDIGSLDAGQINAAQQQINDYLEQQGIGGRRIIINIPVIDSSPGEPVLYAHSLLGGVF